MWVWVGAAFICGTVFGALMVHLVWRSKVRRVASGGHATK